MHTGPRRRHSRRSASFERRSAGSGRRAGSARLRERKPAQPELAPVLAFLGTLLAAGALPIKAAGLYRVSQALQRLQVEEPDDRMNRVLYAAAGHPLAVANGMLLAGGVMMIYALRWGGFQKRWFLWSTLVLGLIYIWQPFFGTVFGIVWLQCVMSVWKRKKPAPIREVIVIPE